MHFVDMRKGEESIKRNQFHNKHSMDLFQRLIVIMTFLALDCLCLNENSCEAPNRECFHVTALVPARKGSKGVKNKNLSRIGNESLLSRTLRIINECRIFDSVWVSTDGKNIAEESSKLGAKIHWRDPKSATDNASTSVVVQDFLQSHKVSQFLAVVQCTSPFVQVNFLREAVDDLITTNSDCIFSVTRSHQLRWIENNDGFVSPLNFDPRKRPRRQDWQGELVENGMFYIFKTHFFRAQKVFQNNRCRTFEIPKQFSLEIDTEFDLMLANAMMPLLKLENR